MRYSKQRKQDTRDRILRSARTLFALKGFAATSIDEIMQACSLTRGGFYAHFSSKSELYREALGKEALGNEALGNEAPGNVDTRTRSRAAGSDLKAILDQCLSSHGGEVSMLGFLASDVASDDPAVRAGYTAALKSLRDKIRHGASGMPGGEEAILASAAMIVGALAISRTADDAAFAESLLDACRCGAETLLEHADVFVKPAFFWMPTPRSSNFT